MSRERYRIGDLTVDVDAVSVTRGGETVTLPGLSFDLLVALARRAPAVVPADDLITSVWAGTAVSDETLTQRVALLRRALGDDAKNPRYVRAVRGRGYQLAAAVSALSAEDAAPSVPASGHGGRLLPVSLAALAVLGIALSVVFVYLVYGRSRTAAPPLAANPSVQELLQRAGSYLRQHQEPNNELAVELYQRALQREPDNPQALAGLSLALGQRATKFNHHGPESDQAVVLAQRALSRDPKLGQAHHALALALDSQGRVQDAITAYQRAADLETEPANALASAANLLQIQGHLASALEMNLRASQGSGETPIYLEVQMGTTLGLLGDDRAATVWFERAQELRPDNVFAAAAYARMRLSQGRAQEADAIAARALRRGIRRPELAAIRGDVSLLGGDTKQAAAHFREALAIAPGFPEAEVRLLLLTRPPDLEARSRDAIAGLRRGRAAGDEWPDGALTETLLATSLGDNAAALQALDAAIDLGARDTGWLLLDPMLAGLRRDPGFPSRIERIRWLVAAERQRAGSAARM